MPIADSDGNVFESEWEATRNEILKDGTGFLSSGIDSSTEPTARITVTKRKDGQGEIFPADGMETMFPERWDFLNKLGLNADFDKIPEGTGENFIDDRNGARWNQTLSEYQWGNTLPDPVRRIYQSGVADGKWDLNAFKNFWEDQLKGYALYAPNQISKDAGFEDADPGKLDPFEAAAARTKQSVTQRQEGKLTKGMEVLGSMPIEFVKKLKNFTEAAMSMPLGASVQDHPEVADMAASVAFDLMGVGMSTMPLKPGLGLFAGRMSPAAVKAAEKMEKEGFSPISVKEMTGLERGADGFWRREIDDSTSKINWGNFKKDPEFLNDAEGNPIKGVTVAALGDVFEHPQFFEAYPDAKDVMVILDKATDKGGGYFDPRSEMIVLYGKNESPEHLREILVHELQHYIQRTEGFNWGSAAKGEHLPPDMRDKIRGYLIRKYGKDKLQTLKEVLMRQHTRADDWATPNAIAQGIIDEADYRLYRAVAGETEAWNTGRRLNMTAKERRKSLGRETEDTPRSEQIIHTNDQLYLGSPY